MAEEQITITLDDLINSLNSLNNTVINIPDMVENPYVIMPQVLSDQQYYFEFHWSIRQQRCFLSLYKIKDDERIYYVKNKALLNQMDVSKYITATDWTGNLWFESINDNELLDYTQKDIGNNFVLKYVA